MNYKEYLDSLTQFSWLSCAGATAEVRTVQSIQAIFDVESSAETWSCLSHGLESRAIGAMGNEAIDTVFDQISALVREPLLAGLARFLDSYDYQDEIQRDIDRGLYPEAIDWITRDLCWAGVEARLDQPGFFQGLLSWYQKGRWPCAWDGEYPAGQVVLL